MTITAFQRFNSDYSTFGFTITDADDNIINAINNNSLAYRYKVDDRVYGIIKPTFINNISSNEIVLEFPVYTTIVYMYGRFISLEGDSYSYLTANKRYDSPISEIREGGVSLLSPATIDFNSFWNIKVVGKIFKMYDNYDEYLLSPIEESTYSIRETGYHLIFYMRNKENILYRCSVPRTELIRSTPKCGLSYINTLNIIPPLKDISVKYDIYRNGRYLQSITSDSSITIHTALNQEGNYTVICTRVDEWYYLPSEPVSYDVRVGEVSINFYRNRSEDIIIDKEITGELNLSGKIKEATSIINPELTVEFNGVFDYNYCYIPRFKRYYYITDITLLRTKLWRISLSVDVLMSFKEDIKNQYALISRNEFDWDDLVIDEKVPAQLDYVIFPYYYGDFKTKIAYEGIVKEYTWNLYEDRFISNHISKFSPTTDRDFGMLYSPNITSASNIWFFPDITSFDRFLEICCTPNFFESLINTFTNFGSYINSVYACPLDYVAANNALKIPDTRFANPLAILEKSNVVIADKAVILNDVPITAYPIYSGNRVIMWSKIGDREGMTDVPTADSFLDREGFSRYILYIPYIGNVEVEPFVVYKGLCNYLVYNVDVTNGNFIAYLSPIEPNFESADVPQLNYWEGNLYTKLPLGLTNMADVHRNGLLNAISIGSQLASVVGGMALDVQKGAEMTTPKRKSISKKGEKVIEKGLEEGITGYYGTLTRSLASTIAVGTPSGNSTALQDDILKQRLIKVPTLFKIKADHFYTDNYNHTYGRPLMEDKVLGSMSGYTEVGAVHLEGFEIATQNEKEEVERLLLTGVIL